MKFILTKFREKVDVLGVLLSSVCAVHCLAVPLLLAFGIGFGSTAVGAFFSGAAFDLFVLSLSIPLAVVSLLHAYYHGVSRVMAGLFVAALICFSLGFGHTHHSSNEIRLASLLEVGGAATHTDSHDNQKAVFFALGGLLIAALHFTSSRAAKKICCEH